MLKYMELYFFESIKILVCAFLCFLIGIVWYSKFFFQKIWERFKDFKFINYEKYSKPTISSLSVIFIMNLLISFGFFMLKILSPFFYTNFLSSIYFGIFIFSFFIAPVFFLNSFIAHNKIRNIHIDFFYVFTIIILTSIIIGI